MKRGLIRRLLFFAFVAGVAAFAYYDSRKLAKEKEAESKEAAFFSEELENLIQIRIKNPRGEILLIKKNRDWLMEKPLRDLASLAEISRWFDEIKNQKIQRISLEGDLNWRDYHLEKGQAAEAALVFAGPSQKTLSFSVSGKSSFDGRFFLNKEGELLLGERHFEEEISKKDPDVFRSKKILPSLGHALQAVFEGRERISLAWSDYKWSLEGKKSFPLNEAELKSFWASLSQAEAEALKDRSPAAMKKYGLTNPQARIFLNYGKGGEVKITIGPFQAGKAHVSSSHRNFLFEVSEDEVKKWLLSEKRIRDHKAPFRYEKEKAAWLELKSPSVSYTFKKARKISGKSPGKISGKSPEKKTGKGPGKGPGKRTGKKADKESSDLWERARPENQEAGNQGQPLDSKKIAAILIGLRELEGKKYKKPRGKAAAGPEIGPEAGKIYFAVRDSEGNLLFEMRERESSGSLVWVQTNLSGDLIAIPKAALKNLLKKTVYKEPDPSSEKPEDSAEAKKPPNS